MKKMQKIWIVIRKYGNTQFLIFLSIAVCLWYMNKLSAVYTDQIKIPVNIIGADPTIEADDNPYFNLTLKVRASGFALLQNRLFSYPPRIDIPLGDLTWSKKENESYSVIHISSLERALAARLNSAFDLLSVTDTEVTAYIDKYTSKTVPVKPNIVLDLKGQYMQVGEAFVQPAMLTISGKESDLAGIEALTTKPKVIRSSGRDAVGVLEIEPQEGVVIPERSVRYKIELEQYTEQSCMLPVQVFSARDSVLLAADEYTVIPDSVRIVCNVSKSNFNKFSVKDAIAGVVYRPSGGDNRYEVQVDIRHKGVDLVSIAPIYVTVLKNE